MVVRLLYSNTSDNKGLKAAEKILKKYIFMRVITTVLKLPLTLNNFVFNCQYYLQNIGCAMDILCTASYANLFMDISGLVHLILN